MNEIIHYSNEFIQNMQLRDALAIFRNMKPKDAEKEWLEDLDILKMHKESIRSPEFMAALRTLFLNE